jgi:hypothetical protein
VGMWVSIMCRTMSAAQCHEQACDVGPQNSVALSIFYLCACWPVYMVRLLRYHRGELLSFNACNSCITFHVQHQESAQCVRERIEKASQSH